MSNKIKKLLENRGDNHIFPFFWQHGEDEQTLRTYMRVIDEANIKAVCVESRPHPDYCGPRWWKDMDIILDEARKRRMKVWILDDSHFPTGYANGAMKNQPMELHRQSIYYRKYICDENKMVHICEQELKKARAFEPNMMEMRLDKEMLKTFEDDQFLGVYAFKENQWKNLDRYINHGQLHWEAPENGWEVYVLHLTRNAGYHRNYINMLDTTSCRVLIDAVYEPHYEHYKNDFGTTIAGFFSDEPELGNGHIYNANAFLGTDMDFPWSKELESRIKKALGDDYPSKLILLWNNDADADEIARVRYLYMDAVTKLVSTAFSNQLGDWCRAHGVKYIGHMIEDNNQHVQTGSSLGHFYRGLSGQDMAGIDDIGGQVMPQGEDFNITGRPFGNRIGEFYHYMLGKLASSHAALDPKKKGDAMCEIFGAYGWKEGVRLEKYLVDHFLVRGINHYVPHAFSAKNFPDPDCPPHFYAHGHNPQYRHFGMLMAYLNRVCELISDGYHVAKTAVFYHGESAWCGNAMESHKVAHKIYDQQIEYDLVPQDVFNEDNEWNVVIGAGTLKINTQEYNVICVPQFQYVTKAFANAIIKMHKAGVKVVFIDGYPEGICDASQDTDVKSLIDGMKNCVLVGLDDVAVCVRDLGGAEVFVEPAYDRLRYYHYVHKDGLEIYFLVNEGIDTFRGQLKLRNEGCCYLYNAWDNCIELADYKDGCLNICVEPLKSKIVVFDNTNIIPKVFFARAEVCANGITIPFEGLWMRSICKSKDYPAFEKTVQVKLPDNLADEMPVFSGVVRYENYFITNCKNKIVLEITDAYEGVELWVNDQNLGIQIVPPFRYDITKALIQGKNKVCIEVATTLEREMSVVPTAYGMPRKPECGSGITGIVSLWKQSIQQ